LHQPALNDGHSVTAAPWHAGLQPCICRADQANFAEAQLKRRDFLKSTAALAGTASMTGGIRSARSETPRDTLLVLVENGVNSATYRRGARRSVLSDGVRRLVG
jgi:hypothetical protein